MKFKDIYFPQWVVDAIKRNSTLAEQEFLLQEILTEELKEHPQEIKDFISDNPGIVPMQGNVYYATRLVFILGRNRIEIDYAENAEFIETKDNIYYFLKDKKILDFPRKFSGDLTISGSVILQNKEEFSHFQNILQLKFSESTINYNKL